MKRTCLALTLTIGLVTTACGANGGHAAAQSPAAVSQRASSAPKLPPGHPSLDGDSSTNPHEGAADASLDVSGTVAQTLNAAGYTYIRIRTSEGDDVWTAVPAVNVQIGQEVTVKGQLLMENFKSKTLNRSFDEIVFGTLDGDESPMPAGPETSTAVNLA